MGRLFNCYKLLDDGMSSDSTGLCKQNTDSRVKWTRAIRTRVGSKKTSLTDSAAASRTTGTSAASHSSTEPDAHVDANTDAKLAAAAEPTTVSETAAQSTTVDKSTAGTTA
jgi:hypothetical protein